MTAEPAGPVVRPVAGADFAQWLPLWDGYNAFYGREGYLQDLYTAASARGRGVGRALIDAVAERARAAGTTRLYWQTHESNHAARRLYATLAKHSGFIV
jgi:GNAT superfamily N-acetyltransferase